MVNSQHVSRHIASTIQGNRHLRGKLPQTNPRIDRRQGCLWSQIYYKAQKKRAWLPILCEMEGIPHFGNIIGTGRNLFWWWWSTDAVQRTASTLKNSLLSYPTNNFHRYMPFNQKYNINRETRKGLTSWRKDWISLTIYIWHLGIVTGFKTCEVHGRGGHRGRCGLASHNPGKTLTLDKGLTGFDGFVNCQLEKWASISPEETSNKATTHLFKILNK